uniref:Uncharacterized protein n=1 Tax=Avena sativa TaxID=4498 RepID=A0ACD5ZYJ5_AVESA
MMKSWLRRHWPPPRALVLARFAMMKRHLLSHVAVSLLQLPLLQMRMAGCTWVGAAAPATSRRLCLERKVSSVVSSSSPFRCIRCRRPGHRERFCRARFLAARFCSPDSRARSPDARAPCQRSRSPVAQPRLPSSARSWADVVATRRCVQRRRQDPLLGVARSSMLTTVWTLSQAQVALMRMELLQLVEVRIEEVARPLREEVATLKSLLVCVDDSLELAVACTSGGLGLAPAQASSLLDSTEQKSSVVEEHLYGCVSPRGSPCSLLQPVLLATFESKGMDGVMAPVLQITPELHELSEESVVVLLLELGSFGDLAVATTPSPSQSHASVGSGGVWAHNSEALFARELCSLLASLEAVSPGYGKDVACVLAGKASEGLIRKVGKSLSKAPRKTKTRKRGISRKASGAA